MTNFEKVRGIAARLYYGLGFLRLDSAENYEVDTLYQRGGIDTIAHVAACEIVQGGLVESMPTSDVVEVLGLNSFPTQEEILFRLGLLLADSRASFFSPPGGPGEPRVPRE